MELSGSASVNESILISDTAIEHKYPIAIMNYYPDQFWLQKVIRVYTFIRILLDQFWLQKVIQVYLIHTFILPRSILAACKK